MAAVPYVGLELGSAALALGLGLAPGFSLSLGVLICERCQVSMYHTNDCAV